MRRNPYLQHCAFFPEIAVSRGEDKNPMSRLKMFRRHSRTDNIEQFHRVISERQKNKSLSSLTPSKPISRIRTQPPQSRPSIVDELISVTKDLKDIKIQLLNRKSHEEKRMDGLINLVEATMSRPLRLVGLDRMAPPPMMYPIPMPYPAFQGSDSHFQRRDSVFANKKSKYNQRFYKNPQRYRRLWKKYANAVLFIVLLRRFCQRVRDNRMITFQKFMGKIDQQLLQVRRIIIIALQQFLAIILKKDDVSFDILPSDKANVIREKALSLRKLVGLVLDSLMEVFYQNMGKKEWVQSFYFLCKHGSYSCNYPLLTKGQLQIMCISPAWKYVSAQKYLEKSAIINTIFIKLILFNILLTPEKLDQRFHQQSVSNNLYVVSSILYELVIDVQDEYMLLVPKSYPIGNYKDFRTVKGLTAITVRDSDEVEGEIISGLKGEQWVERYFGVQAWREEKGMVKEMVDMIKKGMNEFHKRHIERFK